MLSTVAVDLASTPASQAYTERIFSVCGDLTARKRNRTRTSLQRRVFLKANTEIASLRLCRFKQTETKLKRKKNDEKRIETETKALRIRSRIRCTTYLKKIQTTKQCLPLKILRKNIVSQINYRHVDRVTSHQCAHAVSCKRIRYCVVEFS